MTFEGCSIKKRSMYFITGLLTQETLRWISTTQLAKKLLPPCFLLTLAAAHLASPRTFPWPEENTEFHPT